MVKSPYETLGVPPSATDAQLRSAYRRLVQLHHPDHNGNSAESTRRFEEVQDAYAQVVRERKAAPPRATQPPRATHPPPPGTDPDIESRLHDLEREVRAANAARERVRRAARKAAAEATPKAEPTDERPSDEELGYVSTDDSFGSIFAEARTQFLDRIAAERKRTRESQNPVVRHVSDLIDGLDDLASKLDRKPPK